MATLFAKIKINKGKEKDFEDVCRALHKETMTEKGCRQYSYWRANEERTYYCLLVFDSYKDFLIHQSSDYHENLIVPRGPEFFEDFSTEWLDPLEGASDGPPTEHQAAAPSDPELERRYSDMMPAVVAGWWKSLRGAA